MRIHAYRETFVGRVQKVLGEALDYAVNSCNIPGTEFVKLFIVSSVSSSIENGEPIYLVGRSGIELALDVLAETREQVSEDGSWYRVGRSTEYWIGWAVAYYQWFSGRKFSEIFQAMPYGELEIMYQTLHEADISKFVDVADSRMKSCFPETNLKRIRNLAGLTQAELAKYSGVSLRSIQMYEQRNKDINRAGAETVLRLAKELGCTMEDLVEK